ncbi:hypothetical protein TREES_T100013265 [Tupaia chinensis]|uniref:Uncharacterized protein n=1 Tax=Tupaia chinensis TaxID=246437 RepID=L9KJW8_TUPCH|nr:hypothetical protein TREES_T100013265 [Tupaia chinensis]
MARVLGGAVATVLILGVALAIFFLYCRQQKSQLGLDGDGDGSELPSSQKIDLPLDKESHLAPEDVQSLHLEPGMQQQEEEELQKLPPYYDMGVSPSSCPLVPGEVSTNVAHIAGAQGSGLKDTDVQYAELDTSALELMPGPRTTLPGPGEVVEYATIQLRVP